MKINISPDWDAIKEMLQGKLANMFVLRNLCICLGISFTMLLSGYVNPAHLFLEEVQAATGFNDDASIRDYSREAVESLVETGGIKGYPDNTFRAEGTITRVEALSLLANSLDPDGSKRDAIIESLSDSDYSKTENQISDINTVWGGNAKDLLIVSGSLGLYYNNSTETVTRAEFAQMTSVLLEKLGGEALTKTDGIERAVGDYTTSHTKASDSKNTSKDTVQSTSERESILKLYSAGIINGSTVDGVENCYLPQTTLTREQAATIVYKALHPEKRTQVTIPSEVTEGKYVDNGIYMTGVAVDGKIDGMTITDAPITYDLTDPNRLSAKAGDVVEYKGYHVIVEEKYGVVGADQPLALDEGRVDRLGTVCSVEAGTVWLSDKSTGVDYFKNPETGEMHTADEWYFIEGGYDEQFMATNPEIGDSATYGLGGWYTATRTDLFGYKSNATEYGEWLK